MSLKGSLNSVDLANIFQMLSINQKEGTLNIFDGQSQKSIYFSREGVSMLSRGKPKSDSLGRILMRFDQLSREQLDRALEIQQRTGQLLGSVLEENDILARVVVEDALRLQIEEEIYSLFIWKDAEFEFIEGAPPAEFEKLDGNIRKLTFNVNSLIMEAARRIDEWAQIEARVSSMDEIYRYTGRNMDLVDPIFQEPYCDKVLAAIDGKSNVQDLIQSSYVNKFEVCKIVSMLLEQGGIEPVPAADLAENAEAAIRDGDVPDAIKFLNRVIDLGQDSAQTHLTLANGYQASDEIAKAGVHYRKYAEASLREGAPEEAFTTYLRVCEMLPTDLHSAERLIEVYFEHRDVLESQEEEVVRRGATLATMLLEVSQRDRAIATLKRVCALAPDDEALRHLLVKIYLDSGQSEQALAEYQSMVDRFSARKEWGEVGKLLRKMLTISPGRQDLRERMEQVLTRSEKNRQMVRRIGWITLIALILGFVLFGYVQYDHDAQEEIALAEGRSTAALIEIRADLERTEEELDSVARALNECTKTRDEIADIFVQADQLHNRCQSLIRENVRTLQEVADRYRYSLGRGNVSDVVDEWRKIGSGLEKKLAAVRVTMHRRAVEIAAEATARNDSGHIVEALTLFRIAARMAVGLDPSEKVFAARLARNVRLLEKRLEGIEASLAAIRDSSEQGRYQEAREKGIEFLRLHCDLTGILGRVPVPLRVESEPAGAEIFLNGEATGTETPGWVDWCPGIETELTIQLGGFLPAVEGIPALDVIDLEADLKRVESLKQIRKPLYREPVWWESVNATVDAAPAVDGGAAFLATRKAKVVRIDPFQHQIETVCQVDSFEGIASGPAVREKSIYFATIEGRLERIDLGSGVSRWRQQVPGRVYAPICVEQGMVVVGDSSGHLSVHDQSSGSLVWRRPVPGEIVARPVLSAGQIFVVSSNGRLYIHALAGGQRAVALSPEEASDRFTGAPCVSGGKIYVCTTHGYLTAFDAGSRRRLWRVKVAGELRSGPAIDQGVLVVGSLDGLLHAVRDGRVLGSVEMGNPVIAPATAADGTAYAASDTGLVLAARIGQSGLEILWRVDLAASSGTPVRMRTPPVVIGHRVLVVSEDGVVFLLAR